MNTEFDPEKRKFLIHLSNPLEIGEIRYSVDGSDPNSKSTLYAEPFIVKKTTVIKTVTVIDGQAYSGISEEKVWIHKATGARVEYKTEFSQKYTAGGPDALTNSLRGSINLGDGRWQGYSGNNMEVILDLGQEKDISRISVGCLQTVGSWVFFPDEVSAEASNDGKIFTSLGTAKNQSKAEDQERKIQNFTIDTHGVKTRYIKINAKNIGECPDWHAGAGNPAWLFIDEIVVE